MLHRSVAKGVPFRLYVLEEKVLVRLDERAVVLARRVYAQRLLEIAVGVAVILVEALCRWPSASTPWSMTEL